MIKNNIVYSEYCNYRFKLKRAEGSYLWDENGRKYIDFTSGWNVTNLGWNDPEINTAIKEQVDKNVFAPLWCSDEIQEKYAQRLTESLPEPLDTCIKTTGGTEAVEVSIKVARAATGRKKIIGFKNSYHGQLFASMALGFTDNLVEKILPLVPEFIQIDYPRDNGDKEVLNNFLMDLEKRISNHDVAAIVTEANMITGWGSAFVAPIGYLKAVRDLVSKYGTLLIVDEVGTGFSRTGKLFAIEHENVVPDMICLAKGISNGGGALGAVVGSFDLINNVIGVTNIISTFGWVPTACAAALKTLEIHQRDKVWEMADSKGRYLLSELKSKLANNPKVVDVRGVGMEIGIEIPVDATRYNNIIDFAAKEGLHLTGDTESVIQLMPPLTISKEDIEKGIDILVRTLSSC